MSRKRVSGVLRILDLTNSLIEYERGVTIMERLAEAIRLGTPLGRKYVSASEEPAVPTARENESGQNCLPRDKESCADIVVLLQHSPVYTLGKRGSSADFKVPEEEIRRRLGATVSRVGRGGEVTYHGPGQLVAYPLVSIRRAGVGVRAFVEGLEDVTAATCGEWGVRAVGRVPGATGVWVDEQRKIAAIGVQIRHGVSTHGLALNVRTDLSHFDMIVPCGIADKEVTSLEKEMTGNFPSFNTSAALRSTSSVSSPFSPSSPPAAVPQVPEVADCLVRKFQVHFGYASVLRVSESDVLV